MFEGILQPMHLLLILLILVVFFGPQKLPQLGKGLGESISEFRKAMEAAKSKSEPEPPQQQKTDAPKQISQ